ncbi:hypothetical protein [Nitratireductor indicus]|uniref:hypothetical protein n=1 Tax=Nitratireductor indicus TaxID=721133 RepID=UPI0028759A6A|nr:hypothetical protein [Nitratireductor indicus]MDS1138612.1 hypothetical protein [Nitratireductor indicus]
MAKRERPAYAFIRRGNSLVPEMDFDARALDGVANGQRVKVDVSEFRSAPRLRAYWAMLHDVVTATECAPSAERLHEAMKLELGIVDHVQVKGFKVAVPASIAFDRMTESEMVEYFNLAQRWLAETYGYVPEDRSAA